MEIACPQCKHTIEYEDSRPGNDFRGVTETVTSIDCPNCGRVDLLHDSDFTLSFVPPETFSHQQAIGHFVLIEKLGSGSFGEVWLADDVNLKRKVALKLPKATHDNSALLLREAQTAAKLNHPNIVSIYEVGAIENQVFIASEYIRGITLADELSSGVSPIEKTVELLRSVAMALDYAHQQSVIHRDIKPANILLNTNGEPFVTDFGLAKIESDIRSISSDGQILGTVRYMSPEQAKGRSKEADPRSDIYALGVTFFEMLTGYAPFLGNIRAVLHKKIYETAPSPRSFDLKIPKDLETICLKCLETNPDNRYQTAGELALELQRYSKNEPIKARPVSAFEKVCRWRQRKPLVAGLLLSLSVSLIGGFLGILYYSLESNRNANETLEALYRSNMNLVSEYFNKGDYTGMQRVFDRYQSGPDISELKGFEWHFYNNFLSTIHQQVNQGVSVTQIALSQDGRLLATLGTDRLIRVWETQEMKPVRNLSLDVGRFNSIDFSPTRNWLISGSNDGFVRIWNPAESDVAVHEIKHGPQVHFVKSSPDGKQFLSAGKTGAIRLWSLDDISLNQDIPSGKAGMADACFSADGQSLVVASRDGLVRFWNLAEAKIFQQIKTLPITNSKVKKIALAEDGAVLVTGHYNGEINLWSAETGDFIFSYNALSGRICNLAFMKNSPLVAIIGSTGHFFMFDVNQQRETRRMVTHSLSEGCLAKSHNGKFLAIGSGDGSLKLMKSDLLIPPEVYWQSSNTKALSFLNDGSTFISGTADGTVRVWDLEQQQENNFTSSDSEPISLMAVQSGRRLFATVRKDDRVTIHDVESGQLIERLNLPGSVITTIEFSQRGDRFAVATDQKKLYLYQSENWKVDPVEIEIGTGRVIDLAFSPNSNLLAAACRDGKVYGIDLEKARILGASVELTSLPYTLVFSQTDGEVMIGTDAGEIVFAELSSGKINASFSAHSGRVNVLQVFPKGKTLVSAGRDGEIKLWDIKTRELITKLVHHRRQVFNLAISPDGRRMLSGGLEGDIRIWDGSGL